MLTPDLTPATQQEADEWLVDLRVQLCAAEDSLDGIGSPLAIELRESIHALTWMRELLPQQRDPST